MDRERFIAGGIGIDGAIPGGEARAVFHIECRRGLHVEAHHADIAAAGDFGGRLGAYFAEATGEGAGEEGPGLGGDADRHGAAIVDECGAGRVQACVACLYEADCDGIHAVVAGARDDEFAGGGKGGAIGKALQRLFLADDRHVVDDPRDEDPRSGEQEHHHDGHVTPT